MLNVAIIGAGQVAQNVHVVQYQKYPEEVQVVAVMNWHVEKAEAFAKRNGIPHYFGDIEEMFRSVSIDAVSICTPNRFHYEHVMTALRHGVHVLCEKPPALKAEQAQEMAEYAEQQGCILAYNFHNRFAEDVAVLKQQIKKGAFGEIYVAEATALRRSGVPGWGVFTDKDIQGGGPLIDIGIHMLDLVFYLLDYPEVEDVSAVTFQKIGTKKSRGTFGTWDPEKYTVEDAVFAFLRCRNGLLIKVETSYALNILPESQTGVRLMGERAGATLFPLHVYTDEEGESVTLLQLPPVDDRRSEKSLRHFIEACQGKDVMLATGREGYFIQSIVDRIYRAAEKAGGKTP